MGARGDLFTFLWCLAFLPPLPAIFFAARFYAVHRRRRPERDRRLTFTLAKARCQAGCPKPVARACVRAHCEEAAIRAKGCGPKMVRGSAAGNVGKLDQMLRRKNARRLRVLEPRRAEEIALDRARSGALIFPDATERQSASTELTVAGGRRGTESSNPARSSGESGQTPNGSIDEGRFATRPATLNSPICRRR
jgi:hypothetical protein